MKSLFLLGLSMLAVVVSGFFFTSTAILRDNESYLTLILYFRALHSLRTDSAR